MRRNWSWFLAGVLVIASMASCTPLAPVLAGETGIPPTTAHVTVQSPPVIRTAEPETPTPPGEIATPIWTAVPITPAPPISTEEKTVVTGVPISTPFDPALEKLVAQAQDDLAGRLGIGRAQVELVDVQTVIWPDGGLGCPQPGMAYTQVQVDGLLIRFRVAGRVYEYHAGGARSPFLCE